MVASLESSQNGRDTAHSDNQCYRKNDHDNAAKTTSSVMPLEIHNQTCVSTGTISPNTTPVEDLQEEQHRKDNTMTTVACQQLEHHHHQHDSSMLVLNETSAKCLSACAAYGHICPCAARIAAASVSEAIEELMVDSKIFPQPPNFRYFNPDDISVGEKLGAGGFCSVNKCTIKKSNDDDPDSHPEYAIKFLKRQVLVTVEQFKHGAADLAVEAFFLQNLNHPNIIRLQGITAGSIVENVSHPKECSFFIIVDQLYEILENKLQHWKTQEAEQAAKTNFLVRLYSAEYRETKRLELLQRLRIALDIAGAMQYLHSLGIIFRDLKPDNIGFDRDGVVKLFDFGLAKELKNPKANGTYQLTGHTGSRRYMAPEVALDLPYNQAVDVYSFGILLWELCSAEKPFYGYTTNKHMHCVVLGDERPKMDSAHVQFWPAALQKLMKTCWAKEPPNRLSFDQVIDVLQNKLLSSASTPPGSSSNGSLQCSEISEAGETLPKDERPTRFRYLSPLRNLGNRGTSLNLPVEAGETKDELPAHNRSRYLSPLRTLGNRGTSLNLPVDLKPLEKSKRTKSWGLGGGAGGGRQHLRTTNNKN